MTKHVVHAVKVEQPKIIKSTTQRKESIWRSQPDDHRSRNHRGCEEARDHQNEGAENEIRSRQRSNSMTSSRCSPQKQHRQVPTVQAVQKTVEIHQAAVHRQSCRHLREHAEVNADGAGSARTAQKISSHITELENRRRCTSTAQ